MDSKDEEPGFGRGVRIYGRVGWGRVGDLEQYALKCRGLTVL